LLTLFFASAGTPRVNRDHWSRLWLAENLEESGFFAGITGLPGASIQVWPSAAWPGSERRLFGKLVVN